MTDPNESVTISKARLRHHLETFFASLGYLPPLPAVEMDMCVDHVFNNELMIQQAEASVCLECGKMRPDDDRVTETEMRCEGCAYGY